MPLGMQGRDQRNNRTPHPHQRDGRNAHHCPDGKPLLGHRRKRNETALSFSSPGTIGQLNVKVGDRVRKGQPLATIDPQTSRNAYDMAHATRVQAEDAYRRMKQLHDKGSLSEIKWVEAQSQLQQAVAAENIARKNLDDCTLTAPCDGIVSETNGEPGQNVVPGPPVVKLVSTTLLNVVVSVPENEIARMRMANRPPSGSRHCLRATTGDASSRRSHCQPPVAFVQRKDTDGGQRQPASAAWWPT